MTLLADVVTASRAVAETSSRSRKVATLAEALRRLDASEVAAKAVLALASRSSANRREELVKALCESRRGGDEMSGAGRHEPARVKRCGERVADPLHRGSVGP